MDKNLIFRPLRTGMHLHEHHNDCQYNLFWLAVQRNFSSGCTVLLLFKHQPFFSFTNQKNNTILNLCFQVGHLLMGPTLGGPYCINFGLVCTQSCCSSLCTYQQYRQPKILLNGQSCKVFLYRLEEDNNQSTCNVPSAQLIGYRLHWAHYMCFNTSPL